VTTDIVTSLLNGPIQLKTWRDRSVRRSRWYSCTYVNMPLGAGWAVPNCSISWRLEGPVCAYHVHTQQSGEQLRVRAPWVTRLQATARLLARVPDAAALADVYTPVNGNDSHL